MTIKAPLEYVFDLNDRVNRYWKDPHNVTGYTQSDFRQLGTRLVGSVTPSADVPEVVRHLRRCSTMRPEETRASAYDPVSKCGTKLISVRDNAHYHDGSVESCNVIYGTLEIVSVTPMDRAPHKNLWHPQIGRSFFGDGVELRAEGDRLILHCDSNKSQSDAMERLNPVLARYFPDCDVVTMHCNGVADRVRVEDIRQLLQMDGTIRPVTDAEIWPLFSEASTTGQSLSIVRNDNHQGLLTTNNRSCGIVVPKWIGADMSLYWDAHELARYMSEIERCGRLDYFVWDAYQMTTERAKIRQQGSIERVSWNGVDCRLVRVAEVEFI